MICQYGIKRNMDNSCHTFKVLERVEKSLVVSTKINFYLVFDMKITINYKERYIESKHFTGVPRSMTYYSIVSRDTCKIAYIMAALNIPSIQKENTQNTFLEEPMKNKIFFYDVYYQKSDKEKVVVVVQELYGNKSSEPQF